MFHFYTPYSLLYYALLLAKLLLYSQNILNLSKVFLKIPSVTLSLTGCVTIINLYIFKMLIRFL